MFFIFFDFVAKKSHFGRILFCSKKQTKPLSQIRLFFIDSIFSNTF